MGGISRHNLDTVTIANPLLLVGTVPKTNSETTDLKPGHLILLSSLCTHGSAFTRSVDPKLLLN